jgi:hypothetical protein
MQEHTVTEKLDGQAPMPTPASQPPDQAGAEEPRGRFLHPSGSRPLAGYTIKRGVGSGGFGEIYYALSDAGKEVALKLIRQHLDVELRGIRQCMNLKHPNLVAIFDIREDDQGNSWVVMEYIHGQCLRDVVAANPQGLPISDVPAWIHGIGAAVAYLHDRGVVHRDVKPGNIFLDEGIVKVGDYGLSKFISCSRRSGQTESIGTVHYMAPEVANGRYGKEIDIYALGIVLYEMLTGRVPFDGESVGEVLMKHLTTVPDVSMLPEPYRRVVARALAKDPDVRYKTVGEMLAELPPPAPGGIGVAPMFGGSAGRIPVGPAHVAPPIMAAVVAESSDDEPVLRAVKQCIRQAWASRQASDHGTRALLLILAGLSVFFMWPVLLMVGFPLLVLYAVYRGVREVWLAIRPDINRAAQPAMPPLPPSSARVSDPAAAPTAGLPPVRAGDLRSWEWRGQRPRHNAAQPAPAHWPRPRDPLAAALLRKPPRQRLTELVQSLLLSGLAATAVWIALIILQSYRAVTPRPEQAAWILLVSIAGTWAVLVVSKMWEGIAGDASIRRFLLMVVGMGVGLLAAGLAELLLVDLPHEPGFPHPISYPMPSSFYSDHGTPLALAYVACFGTLFLVLRWWRQADPLRGSRFSLWSLVVSAFVAAVVASAWSFPEPWLVMVAATMSAAVQLCSPCMDRRRNRG